MRLVNEFIERGLRVFERIYPLIRPAAHSVIGKATVFTGLVVMVGPFWEPYVRAASEKYLERTIDPPTSPVWGFALVASGLVYHFFSVRADGLRIAIVNARIRQHDSKIIHSFISNFPEKHFLYSLSQIEADHSIWYDDNILDEARRFIRSPTSQLLDRATSDKAMNLANALHALTAFINCEFFVPSSSTGGRTRLCLRPDWNADRSGSRLPTPQEEANYDAASQQLEILVQNVRVAYEDFIRTAHLNVL